MSNRIMNMAADRTARHAAAAPALRCNVPDSRAHRRRRTRGKREMGLFNAFRYDGQRALGRGGAIGFISSAAGLGWESNLAELQEYIAITDFDAASQWAIDHNHADYMWSKQTICTYVAQEAMGLLKQGIRINAICPGPTD